jgi:hypothetical protein
VIFPEWRLRQTCAELKIRSAAELRRLVEARTGVPLCAATVESYFRDRLPDRIDTRTLTAILNAIACSIADVMRFTPPKVEGEARAAESVIRRYRRSSAPRPPRPETIPMIRQDAGESETQQRPTRTDNAESKSPWQRRLSVAAKESQPLAEPSKRSRCRLRTLPTGTPRTGRREDASK